MPQLHLYVSDEIAAKVRARADEASLSVSRYLARVVEEAHCLEQPAPDTAWIDRTWGGWEGELERPPQPPAERRPELDSERTRQVS